MVARTSEHINQLVRVKGTRPGKYGVCFPERPQDGKARIIRLPTQTIQGIADELGYVLTYNSLSCKACPHVFRIRYFTEKSVAVLIKHSQHKGMPA